MTVDQKKTTVKTTRKSFHSENEEKDGIKKERRGKSIIMKRSPSKGRVQPACATQVSLQGHGRAWRQHHSS
jgi:hypothetical protein